MWKLCRCPPRRLIERMSQLLKVDQPLALPMYLYWAEDDLPVWREPAPDERGNASCGRVVIWNAWKSGGARPPSACFDELTSQDLVTIPLFRGIDPHPSPGTWDRLPAYHDNLATLRELAPRVKGIIVGNLSNCEVTFGPLRRNASLAEARRAGRRLVAFIHELSDLVQDAGGTPAFGLCDIDVILDCAVNDGEARRALIDRGAIVLSFCAYNLYGGLCDDAYYEAPHIWMIEESERWGIPLIEERREASPYLALQDYIRGLPLSIAGMNFLKGLGRGNDLKAREFGFSAGVVGNS